MNSHSGRAGRACAAALALLGVLGLASRRAPAENPGPAEGEVRNETAEAVRTPESVIAEWPERERLAAGALLEKYGRPPIFDDEQLTWTGNRPWDETVVRRDAPWGESIRQSVRLPVPPGKVRELKLLGASLEYDPSSGELSSLADAEELNFLALNMAAEVVAGKRRPDEARKLYRRTRGLAEAGKSSAYTRGFVFPRTPLK